MKDLKQENLVDVCYPQMKNFVTFNENVNQHFQAFMRRFFLIVFIISIIHI